MYEEQCGWEVTERNAERKKWKFQKAEDANIQFEGNEVKTVVPIDEDIVKKHDADKREGNMQTIENVLVKQ